MNIEQSGEDLESSSHTGTCSSKMAANRQLRKVYVVGVGMTKVNTPMGNIYWFNIRNEVCPKILKVVITLKNVTLAHLCII